MPHSDAAPIGGSTDAAFGPVRDAFVENFLHRGELGASLCVVADGVVVVDLWGGWCDRERRSRWQADTLVNVFSVGKAIAALCVARLVGQGHLGFDDPLSVLWPEFAARDKSAITVRQLLSHQGGLPAIRQELPENSIFDARRMTAILADEAPWWEPGTAHGYHVNTFGFLVGELVRRASGRSLGTVVANEIAGPLGADFFIGVPTGDLGRVAEFVGMAESPGPWSSEGKDDGEVMVHHAYFNPPTLSGMGVINSTAWRTAELPSTNAHASGRGIARLYEAMVHAGMSGTTRVTEAAPLAEAVREEVNGPDLILGRPSRFGLGFQLTQPERPLGPNASSFGHFGAGGSLGFCDPTAMVSFGYAINTMGPRWQNPRNRALIQACYECL